MGILTTWMKRKRLQIEAEVRELELLEHQSKLDRRILEATTTLIDTSIPSGETLVSGRRAHDDVQQEMQFESLKDLRRASRRFWYRNPHGHGIIRNLIRYIGRPTLVSESPDPTPQKVWARFWRFARMTLKWKEILTRGYRDGEVFIRVFPDSQSYITLRFIEPDLIRSPMGADFSHGIQTDPNDIEKPVMYWRAKSEDHSTTVDDFEQIPADQIIHVKLNADSDQKRGRPQLEPVIVLMSKYETWLSDRIVLNKIRTAIALVKKIKAPSETISRLRTAQAAESVGTTPNRSKAPSPGSILTASQNIDYEFLAPRVDARDVAADGRTILLAVTAGIGQSEVLVTGDSSNQNYASSLVSEGPVNREIQDQREFWEVFIYELWGHVVEGAIAVGDMTREVDVDVERLGPNGEIEIVTETVDLVEEVSAQWPELTQRNIKDETISYQIQHKMGVASLETLAAKMGHDFRLERRRRLREAKELEQFPDPFLLAPSDIQTPNDPDTTDDEVEGDGTTGSERVGE